MRTGTYTDWTETTRNVRIIDETLSGKLVCQKLTWDGMNQRWAAYGEVLLIKKGKVKEENNEQS